MTIGLAILLRPELTGWEAAMPGGSPPRLAPLLVHLSAVALVACAGWAWLALSVALATSRAGGRVRWAGAPTWLRRVIIAACGLTAVALPLTAHADPTAGQPPVAALTPSLEGLAVPALPETLGPRPSTAPASHAPGPAHAVDRDPRTHDAELVVAPGDSLWSLARGLLPAGADDRQIEQCWRALWQANRAAIGTDPDLIRPGLRLRIEGERQ